MSTQELLSFSQRMGLHPLRTRSLQRTEADAPLRIELWNWVTRHYWERDPIFRRIHATQLWSEFLGELLDEVPAIPNVIFKLKERFLERPYNEMYDLLEAIPRLNTIGQASRHNQKFMATSNEILERHTSAYRFIDGIIVEVTSQTEITAIETALEQVNDRYTSTHAHLSRALELLSDREARDYRNAIKEAVSAVESIACIIAQKPKASLREALEIVDKQHGLHGALKGSFVQLYGYTSDADGIRHKLMEETNLKYHDALFMLVSCSAFVSYLISKSEEK